MQKIDILLILALISIENPPIISKTNIVFLTLLTRAYSIDMLRINFFTIALKTINFMKHNRTIEQKKYFMKHMSVTFIKINFGLLIT